MAHEYTHHRFSVSGLIDRVLSIKALSNLSEEERSELGEDIELVRRLLGEQRSPRIAVVAPADVAMAGVVKSLLGESVTVKEQLGQGRWYGYDGAHGTLRLLDLRQEPGEPASNDAIRREKPDLMLLLWRPGATGLVDALEAAVARCRTAWGDIPATVAAIVEPAQGDFDPGHAEHELRRELVASAIPNESFDVVMRDEESILVESLVRRAPMEVRVRLAHLTWVREVKREVAQSVVRAASGIAGAVATIPIPVADIVPITGLQMAMIAVVAHIGGRELTLGSTWEFVVAMGANVGLGFAFRSMARTAVRFIPLAGSVIAAGIASTATYALGRAAIGYFIGETR